MTLSLESVSIQGGFGFISTLLQAQPFLSKSWRCKYICVCCFCLFQVVYIVLVAWQLVLWKCVHLSCFIFTMFTSIDTWHHWCWGLLLLKCILVCLWDTLSVWTALNSFIGQLVFAACLWSWKLKYMYLYFHMFYLLCQSWITNAVFQINTHFKKTHL